MVTGWLEKLECGPDVAVVGQAERRQAAQVLQVLHCGVRQPGALYERQTRQLRCRRHQLALSHGALLTGDCVWFNQQHQDQAQVPCACSTLLNNKRSCRHRGVC